MDACSGLESNCTLCLLKESLIRRHLNGKITEIGAVMVSYCKAVLRSCRNDLWLCSCRCITHLTPLLCTAAMLVYNWSMSWLTAVCKSWNKAIVSSILEKSGMITYMSWSHVASIPQQEVQLSSIETCKRGQSLCSVWERITVGGVTPISQWQK